MGWHHWCSLGQQTASVNRQNASSLSDVGGYHAEVYNTIRKAVGYDLPVCRSEHAHFGNPFHEIFHSLLLQRAHAVSLR